MKQPNSNEVSPGDGLEMYLDGRQSELAENSLRAYRIRIRTFVEWCRENGIDSLNDVHGIHIHEWKAGMQVGNATTANRLQAVRRFLRWGAQLGIADPELWDKIDVPTGNGAKTVHLDTDTAGSVLTFLDRFEYASKTHVVMLLLWRTGVRLGSLRALDVGDYNREENCLEVRHRPESDTPLKNGEAGERSIALSDGTCRVLDDYLTANRDDVTDGFGRVPFITTRNGRISESALQDTAYAATRPCYYGSDCPEGRDPAECAAASNRDVAYQCPDSVSPHPIRRGSITHHLRNDVPKLAVSDRCDVSPKVLDRHYNQLTEREKMEQRRGYLDDL